MKRWTWVTTALLMPLVALVVIAAGPRHIPAPAGAQLIDNTTFFDANSLLMFVGNTGSFAYDRTNLLGKSDGLYFPKGTNLSVIFAAGIWIGARGPDGIRVAAAEYGNDFVPGPMAGGAAQSDQGSFRVYVINKGDNAITSEDYRTWPFDDGAPALKNAAGEDSLDAQGSRIPLILGDQALYTVYNDATLARYSTGPGGGTPSPLNVEVQHYVFGYSRAGALGTTIFMQYKIINGGDDVLEDTYVSLWADPDLGDAGDDLVGCDIPLSLGFCYNAAAEDASYGNRPPAVGFDFFQGPIVDSAGAVDTILVDGRQREIVGKSQLPMTSFNKYINGTDPSVNTETYFYMQGLEPDGTPHINSSTGEPSKFFMSGDPVTATGELDDNAADRRYMMSSGPFTLNPGDTQVVVAAVVAAQGADRLSSITKLREIDRVAQNAFDANFDIPGPPPQPAVWQLPYENEVLLVWGPQADGDVQEAFHPIVTDSVIQRFVFEGFNVYQGQSASGPWTKIGTFDLDDEVEIGDLVIPVERIYSDLDNPNGRERVVVQRGTNNGLVHELRVRNDAIRGGRLVNNRPYYFAVTAYNYDSLHTVPFTDEAGNVFGIISESFENLPAAPQEGVVPLSQTGLVVDTAEHVAGLAAGSIFVDYVDPLAVSGDDYRVTINPDLTSNLINVTDQETLLTSYEFLVSSEVTEGFVLRAVNPRPGLTDILEHTGWDITSGVRRFTWAGGEGLGFEGFNNNPGGEGTIGWDSPCHHFSPGVCPDPAISPDRIVNVELRLAHVNADGTWDPQDENVSYAYRYLRGATQPPQKPEFAPFIINPTGGYAFQAYAPSVYFSAWNMDVDPPQRLAIGHLENNTGDPDEGGPLVGGMVDGKYWPPLTGGDNNTGGGGPREWLWIFLSPYTEDEPDPSFMIDAVNNNLPIMYFASFVRRNNPPYSPGGTGEDRIIFYANHVFGPNDVFEFTTHAPGDVEGQLVKNVMDNIYPVPNPYYNVSQLEKDQFNREINFVNLPSGKVTIRIFNLAGDCVRVLQKDIPSDGSDPEQPNVTKAMMSWDVLTQSGLPVASGLYIWHAEAEGLGTKIGKVAVFTEVEQIQTY